MIDINVFIPTIIERLENLPVGHYIDARTYKRNRSVIFVKKSEEDIRIIEDGFHQEDFTVKLSKIKKALKTIIKKEFPRSNKVRLYVMEEFDPKQAFSMGRKKL